MLDAVGWVFSQLIMAFYNFGYAITHPGLWLDWTEKTAMVRFIYYGASSEFFFVVLLAFLIITIVGAWKHSFLWRAVRVVEGFGNFTGRLAAWAALVMVLQQIMIVFLQRIFTKAEISLSPFGLPITRDVSWWAEELKLYNAMIVVLCCAYTMIQGGHVRVDLFYAGMRYRGKKIVDMFGSLFFIMPAMTLIWMYGWFFMWRHLVTPKISATDKLELLERKSRLLKWNVETIGFSPNGFDGYFLFKVLLVAFAFMMFVQGAAFFWRSFLELTEGPASEGKYLDKDKLGDELAELVADIH